jgi:DnaJ-class molecular chaperone
MSFEIKCRPCRGDGYYGRDPKDTCGVCGGGGVIDVSEDRDDYVTCGPCRGDGYYGRDPHDTCQACNGLGIVTRAFAE